MKNDSDRLNVLLILAGSLAVMVPWPLIGYVLGEMRSMFEQPDDFILLFGGVSLMLLLPIAMLDPPNWVYSAGMVSIWLIVLALPMLLAIRVQPSKGRLLIAYLLQAGFSIVQAGLGFLMILGRGV